MKVLQQRVVDGPTMAALPVQEERRKGGRELVNNERQKVSGGGGRHDSGVTMVGWLINKLPFY